MDRAQIKTFNSAKKFAEEVLHPLIRSHTDAKIISRLGAINDEEAIKIPPNIRVLQTLLVEVEATIRLNGRECEVELIEILYKQLLSLEDSYEKESDKILEEGDERLKIPPRLTPLFKEINIFVDRIYIQLQRIMTKNKLLFFGDDNEYLDEDDLMEKIKSENRNS